VKKYLIIEGRVYPKHYISDLDENVPYDQEVKLDYEKASWSRDLSSAIQQRCVLKKRVITLQEKATTSPKSRAIQSTSKAPRQIAKPKSAPVTEDASATTEMLEQSLRENEDLRNMNKDLVATTNKLLKSQDLLLEKLTEYMDRPVQVISSGGVASSGGQKPTESYEDIDEDVPTFVPSKIRSGKAKASGGSEVQSESKEASNQLSDATSALKSLRKGKDE